MTARRKATADPRAVAAALDACARSTAPIHTLTERAVRALALLAQGDATIEQLMARCDCERRTAYRLIESIRAAGVPVTAVYPADPGRGPSRGYYSIGGESPPPKDRRPGR